MVNLGFRVLVDANFAPRVPSGFGQGVWSVAVMGWSTGYV